MSKRKLLLADDSVTIQKVVNLTFADEGIEVISVGDGDSAMEKVAEISPDLIMADVNMPGLTGYEICERIRQDEKLSQTPVILLVGSFEPFDEDEARRVGADDYLTKPFQSIRQLVNKVTILLDSHSRENGTGATEASSLDDTLEMDVEDISATPQPAQYADTSFDDEMIQTNRPSSFAFDETQRFESRDTGELGDAPLYETQEVADKEKFEEPTEETETITDEIGESVSDEIEETKSPTYEIKESVAPESETNDFAYEIETNSGVSYELKEDVLDEVETSKDVSDEIKAEEPVLEEFETSEDVTDEIEKTISDEIDEDEQPISYEIKDEESILEDVDEEPSEETVLHEAQDEESVLEEIETSENVIDEVTDEETISADLEREPEQMVEVQPQNEEVELAQTTHEEDIPLPEFASVLETDEDDILQLPPIESDFEEEEEEVVKTPLQSGIVISPAATASVAAPAKSAVEVDTLQISPELIEVIVAKVIERLSENAVKEVAWEVVPQMTELIVKKMAEEKLKE